LMAWVLFAEPITTVTLGGTLLTAVGVALVVRQPSTLQTTILKRA